MKSDFNWIVFDDQCNGITTNRIDGSIKNAFKKKLIE